MRLFLFTFLLMFSSVAYGELDDGIYELSKTPSELKISNEKGDIFFLKGKAPISVGDSWIISGNNENTRFHVTVEVSFQEGLNFRSHLLVVDNKPYTQGSCDVEKDKKLSLNFYLESMHEAKVVAKFLNIKILLKKHPRHNLRVKFSPDKKVYNLGEEVIVNLEIENVGENTVAFTQGGFNRGGRDNQYIFSGRFRDKALLDEGSSLHFGGMTRLVTLESEKFLVVKYL